MYSKKEWCLKITLDLRYLQHVSSEIHKVSSGSWKITMFKINVHFLNAKGGAILTCVMSFVWCSKVIYFGFGILATSYWIHIWRWKLSAHQSVSYFSFNLSSLHIIFLDAPVDHSFWFGFTSSVIIHFIWCGCHWWQWQPADICQLKFYRYLNWGKYFFIFHVKST